MRVMLHRAVGMKIDSLYSEGQGNGGTCHYRCFCPGRCQQRGVLCFQPLQTGFVPVRISQNKLFSLLYIRGLVVNSIRAETWGEKGCFCQKMKENPKLKGTLFALFELSM